ncbi:hypothetical protein MD484_g2348, partial [Candolleomyces efflorescens]
MSSRSWTLLSICLVLAQFFGVALAADDKTKLGNSTIERTVQLRTHSIFAPYIDQDLQNRWWDFGADAYIGWLWSRLALTASNYVIETEFKISGDPSHLYGDGMAMWITTERAQEGPVFGNKETFKGLGIILDTYANDRHGYGFPRVIGVLLDGQTKYDYGDEWTDCLFVPNITLPTNPYLGFSAMTGDVSDAHDIISVTSYSAILSPPEAPKNVMKKTKLWRPSHENTGGSWLGSLFKLAVFVGLCAGGWYGYQEYLRRQRYGGAGAFSLGGGLGSAGLGGSGYGGPQTGGFGGPQSAGFGGSHSPGFGGAHSPGFGGPQSAGFGPPSAGMYANSKRF